MPIINQTRYQPITDEPHIAARVERRYASEIHQLEQLGFERFHYVREAGNVNLLLLPVFAVLMLATRQVFRLRLGRYHIEACYPLLVNRQYATYAHLSGMGLTLATAFVDGSILMTVNTIAIDSDAKKRQKIADERAFHHFYYETDLMGTWNAHRQQLARFQAKDYQVVTELTFEGFARIGLRMLEAGFDIKVRK